METTTTTTTIEKANEFIEKQNDILNSIEKPSFLEKFDKLSNFSKFIFFLTILFLIVLVGIILTFFLWLLPIIFLIFMLFNFISKFIPKKTTKINTAKKLTNFDKDLNRTKNEFSKKSI